MSTGLATQDLRNALAATMLSTGTSRDIPALFAVKLDRTDTHLTFTSTDRYRLTRVIVTLDNPEPATWDALLARDEIARLATVLKLSKSPLAALDRTLAAVSLATDGLSVNAPTVDFSYPKLEGIIGQLAAAPADQVSIDPRWLIALAKMPGRAKGSRPTPVTFTLNGQVKPISSTWTDGRCEYLHLIMPARKADS